MMKQLRCQACGRKHTRSNEQNKLYWAMLNEIADQLKPHDSSFSSETWHAYFKQRFLGQDDIRLPNGKILSQPKSTVDLDSSEMTDYITKIEEFASRYNVIINHE